MKLISPLPRRRGRLEIIPLIDIMFFLLAAFMMVSIDMIKVKSVKVNLPTDVAAAQKETREDFIDITIKADGTVLIDKELIANKDDLLPKLQALYAVNHEQKFLISADQESRHGDVMRVLGRIRAAGFQRVAFSVKPDNEYSPDQAAPTEPEQPATAPTTTPAAPTTPAAATAPAAAPTPAVPASPAAPANTTPAVAPATAPAPGAPPAGQ